MLGAAAASACGAAAAAAATKAATAGGTALPCSLAGSWVHIAASAFDHATSPIWTNQVCVYEWTAAAGPAESDSGAGASLLHVEAPPLACWLDDLQSGSTITATDGTLSFAVNASMTRVGTVDQGCQRVDMADGSLYVRSESGEHPFYMPAHLWLRVAASWLVRAAHVSFEDGSRHLTPGYPTNYDGPSSPLDRITETLV
eukprot:SAG11_NODE_2037_length_3894_cov_3.210277_3_plen_200_part_00